MAIAVSQYQSKQCSVPEIVSTDQKHASTLSQQCGERHSVVWTTDKDTDSHSSYTEHWHMMVNQGPYLAGHHSVIGTARVDGHFGRACMLPAFLPAGPAPVPALHPACYP